jgi:hypothetical protein
MGSSAGRVTVKVRNGRSKACTLVLEPWTTEHVIAPGGALDLDVEGIALKPLEIEVRDDCLVVYAPDRPEGMLAVRQGRSELPGGAS